MTESTHFRRAELEDLPVVLRLLEDLHPSDTSVVSLESCEAVWEAICSDDKIYFGLLEADTELVASCHLVLVPNLTRGASPYGVIENVVTKKSQRGNGYGTLLLKSILAVAWDAGCYKVMLMTGRKDKKVYDFYKRAGFDMEAKQAFVAHRTRHGSP